MNEDGWLEEWLKRRGQAERRPLVFNVVKLLETVREAKRRRWEEDHVPWYEIGSIPSHQIRPLLSLWESYLDGAEEWDR